MCTIVTTRKTLFLAPVMPPHWEAFVRTLSAIMPNRPDSFKAATTYDHNRFHN
ncbi:MAG: hypothetical protein ACR2OW_06195 [Methyloligellaceae bacterium]